MKWWLKCILYGSIFGVFFYVMGVKLEIMPILEYSPICPKTDFCLGYGFFDGLTKFILGQIMGIGLAFFFYLKVIKKYTLWDYIKKIKN